MDERYSEAELEWYIKSESDGSEKIFYIYECLNLDVYQYYYWEKKQSENYVSDSIQMKAYRLSNTKQVLDYKLQ